MGMKKINECIDSDQSKKIKAEQINKGKTAGVSDMPFLTKTKKK